MRSFEQRVVELDPAEEVVIRIPNGPEILVTRVGSDDDDCPFETPFLEIEFRNPWCEHHVSRDVKGDKACSKYGAIHYFEAGSVCTGKLYYHSVTTKPEEVKPGVSDE